MGVTFTEQAWRDFLSFLNANGITNTPPVVNEEDDENESADRIVKAYEKHQETSSMVEDIRYIFAEVGTPMSPKEMHERLTDLGYNIHLKHMTGRIQLAMKKFPEIVKLGRGVYGIQYKDMAPAKRLQPGPERPGDYDAD